MMKLQRTLSENKKQFCTNTQQQTVTASTNSIHPFKPNHVCKTCKCNDLH